MSEHPDRATPTSEPPRLFTVTGRRGLDVALFMTLLAVMLAAAPWLRVYYGVTVIDVRLEKILPDGTTTALATPERFEHLGDGYWPPEEVLRRVRPRIEAFMRSGPLAVDAPEGTRFVWTVRWSQDSLALDHRQDVTWVKRDEGR